MPETMTREEAYAVTDELSAFALHHTKEFVINTSGRISACLLSVASNGGSGTPCTDPGAVQTYATQSARSQVQETRAHGMTCGGC